LWHVLSWQRSAPALALECGTDGCAGDCGSCDNVQESQKTIIPIANLLADTLNTLTISRSEGPGRLYYSAHLKEYLPVEEIEAADRGIIVNRIIINCFITFCVRNFVVVVNIRNAKQCTRNTHHTIW
jgi:hypothetical protein